MDLQQRPDLRHKVTLSPQVYQGLGILAMPMLELSQMVENEMLENPVLELDETESEPAEGEETGDDSEVDDRSWDDWLEMYNDLEQIDTGAPRDPNAEHADTESYVGSYESFEDHLIGQLGLLTLTPEVARAARAVIGSLDADGFLIADLDEIATLAGVSAEEATEGMLVVQQLDPPGVGARDLPEALCIQMHHLGLDEPMLHRMVSEHFADVAAHRVRRIARALGIPDPEVKRLIGLLRELNPRPAGSYSPGPPPTYIVPDVSVRRFGDDWLVTANHEAIPTLRVSPKYRSMLRQGSKADEETKRYLKERIRSAEGFIRNIDRRKSTVSRITGIILEVQRDFFEDGTGPLRPLRLEDVADEIGVHLSTISRGVTGKYMATPYGLFELKHFFSGGYRSSSGMDVASTTIKQRIKDLIHEEDPGKPLSDQRIAEILDEEGIAIARRTVAKYREELGAEPSWARRVS